MGHDLDVEPTDEVDRRRVRIGLVMVSVLVLVTFVLLVAVDEPLGKAIMGAVMFAALVRAALLIRTIRARPS